MLAGYKNTNHYKYIANYFIFSLTFPDLVESVQDLSDYRLQIEMPSYLLSNRKYYNSAEDSQFASNSYKLEKISKIFSKEELQSTNKERINYFLTQFYSTAPKLVRSGLSIDKIVDKDNMPVSFYRESHKQITKIPDLPQNIRLPDNSSIDFINNPVTKAESKSTIFSDNYYSSNNDSRKYDHGQYSTKSTTRYLGLNGFKSELFKNVDIFTTTAEMDARFKNIKGNLRDALPSGGVLLSTNSSTVSVEINSHRDIIIDSTSHLSLTSSTVSFPERNYIRPLSNNNSSGLTEEKAANSSNTFSVQGNSRSVDSKSNKRFTDVTQIYPYNTEMIETIVGKIKSTDMQVFLLVMILVSSFLAVGLVTMGIYWIRAKLEVRRLDTEMRRACLEGLEHRFAEADL